MDLNLTDEQTWLSESVDALLTREPSAWPALVDFGALTLAAGDDGLGAVELALVGRAIGRHLASVPFLDSAAARYATRGIETGSFAALHASGDAVALCLLEPGGSWDLRCPRTALAPRLRGRKAAVNDPVAAEVLLVLAAGDDGRRLALVPAGAPGVVHDPAGGIDPSAPLAAVELLDVELGEDDVLPAEATGPALERLLATGGLLAAAEAVGAAGRLLDLARDYAATRRQFGRTIGSFQALRHILADMYVRHESAWSTVLYAAASLDEGVEDAARTASIAKAYASRATLELGQSALQVFGGIAFTAEHEAHAYLRRVLVRGQQFGDAAHHERAIGRSLLAERERRFEHAVPVSA